MDNFLEEMREQGREDSEGVFTLDRHRAGWKLSRFRLANPRDYPLHLLACAVAGGAGYLEIRCRPEEGTATLSFDGEAYTARQLQVLSAPLLSPSVPAALKELSVVLNVLGSAADLRFTSVGGDEAVELTVSGGQVSLRALQANEPRGQTLSVSTNHQAILNFEALRERGRYAPLKLSLQGERLDQPPEFGTCVDMVVAYYHGVGDKPLVLPPSPESELPTMLDNLAGSPSTVLLALAWPTVAQRCGVKALVHGVLSSLGEPTLEHAFVCGVVEASHLQRDLSQAGFVRDQAYLELVEQVRVGTDRLLEFSCTQPCQMSDSMREEFARELQAWFEGRPTPPQVRRYQAETLVEGFDGTSEALRRVVDQARKENCWEMFEAVREAFRKEAGRARDQGFLHTVLEWLGREEEMLQLADRKDPEWERLHLLWCHLAGESTEEPMAWSQRILEDDTANVYDRYQACLVQAGRMEPGELRQELERLSLPKCWSAWLKTELSLQLGEPAFYPVGDPQRDRDLELVTLFEQGKGRLALERMEQIEGATSSSPWNELVYQLYRGRIGFAESVRLAATRSVGRLFHATPALDKLTEASQGFHHQQLYGSRVFQPDLVPFLWLRLGVLRHRYGRGSEARELLGKVMLQLTLGAQGSKLNLPETLPDRLFSGLSDLRTKG